MGIRRDRKDRIIPKGGNDHCIYRGVALTCVDKYKSGDYCSKCGWNPKVEAERKKAFYRHV